MLTIMFNLCFENLQSSYFVKLHQCCFKPNKVCEYMKIDFIIFSELTNFWHLDYGFAATTTLPSPELLYYIGEEMVFKHSYF